MEAKHFSHNHKLVFHQLAQGSEIKCSGCQSQGSGNVYTCWNCSYFLHEQCFRATRSLKTPSHPLHSLTLVPYPTHQSGSFYCDICKQIGSGLSYCCAECEFDLHVHCALSSSNQPIHSSYPNPPFNNTTMPAAYNPNFPLPTPPPSYPLQPPNFPLPTAHGTNNQVTPPPSYPLQPPNFPLPTAHGTNNQQVTPPPSYPLQPPNFPPPAAPGTNNQVTPPPPYQPPSYPVQPPNFPPPTEHGTNNQVTPPPYQPPSYPVQPPNFPSPPAPIVTNQAPPAPTPTPPAAYPVGNNQAAGPSNQPSQNNTTIPVFPLNVPLTSNNQPKVDEIRHFSHPHALKQMEFTKQDANKCYGCGFILDGSGYSCVDVECKFYLDKECFESPVEVKHKSHLDHTLKLLAKPTYEGGTFTCNACIKEGTGFVYNCSICSFDLHADCVAWPEKVKREDHEHPLTLFFSSPIQSSTAEGQPEVTTICDVCQTAIHEMAWTYSCHECDFATHLECVINKGLALPKSDEQLINEAALKLKVLQLLLSGRAEIIL